MRGDLAERRQAAFVALDRHDALRPVHQQRAGQAARAGTDLDHRHVIERAGRARHLAGQIEIEQEILPERLLGLEAVAVDHVAQRRQAVLGEVHATDRSAICPAIRSAAIRLSGFAWPLPAMSKAVPWSGEVRMKGRPSVTLTASSKASVFAGISAWS